MAIAPSFPHVTATLCNRGHGSCKSRHTKEASLWTVGVGEGEKYWIADSIEGESVSDVVCVTALR